MSLDYKVAQAEYLLQANLSPKSVLLCSFGKDSMVCLDLLRRMGKDLPVIFLRIPVFPEKENFANHVIATLGLKVHSYPPQAVGLSLRDHPEILYYYTMADGQTIMFPVGLHEPVAGEPFACGLELMTPLRGTVEFPWDTIVHGQKASDKHFLFDDMTLVSPVFQFAPKLKAIFPIMDFTDAEVWEYIERFGVAYNHLRYDKANGYAECPDIRFNNDHYYGCVKCVLPGQPEWVECPKGGLVPNRHQGAPIIEIKPQRHMRGSRV